MSEYKLVPKSTVDELAQFIRQVDGNNRMGAGSLADKICERFRVDDPAAQGEPLITLLIDNPEQTANGWELGEWDVEPNAAAVEAFARLAGPGAYGLYAAPQPEQQPIGEMISNDGDIYWTDRHPPMGAKLYTAPQPAEQQHAPDVAEEWSRAFLQIAVVLEAMTSSDSDERLSRMNAGDVLGEAFGTLGRIRRMVSTDVSALVEALEAARQFIVNGIEVGAVRMPDSDTPDPAHNTLPMIDAALAAHRKQGGDR